MRPLASLNMSYLIVSLLSGDYVWLISAGLCGLLTKALLGYRTKKTTVQAASGRAASRARHCWMKKHCSPAWPMSTSTPYAPRWRKRRSNQHTPRRESVSAPQNQNPNRITPSSKINSSCPLWATHAPINRQASPFVLVTT